MAINLMITGKSLPGNEKKMKKSANNACLLQISPVGWYHN